MRVLITGGCGFIGSNAAARFLTHGDAVTVYDNLSRRGSDANLTWLREQGEVDFIKGDVRDADGLAAVVTGKFDAVVHLAGQVAVTSSLRDPRTDFEVNALGTLNLLEAVRLRSPRTIVVNASTNKVYGPLAQLPVREGRERYELVGKSLGVTEDQPLDLHSPYGCSKGAAEQYVLDYARVFGLRTVNLRQSCIYGPRQFGVEDQGWVAWFIIAHLTGSPITVFGNGKQVRDLLHVDDLIDCYARAIERIDAVGGTSFNIGGGLVNTLSILELFKLLEEWSGRPVSYRAESWRRADQPVYISDIRRAADILTWQPATAASTGVRRLYDWIERHLHVFDGLRVS